MTRVRRFQSNASTATLYQVWIHPTARRRHIGTALLASAIRWAQTTGASVMELHVAIGPDSAIEFYRRAGFVETGDRAPLRPGSARLQQSMRLML